MTINDFAKKLGKEDFRVSATNLVDILNTKFGAKESGKPFTNQDVQQYYTRGYLPDAYGGTIIEHKKDITGSYIHVYKESKNE
jgi:hypothetical protein